MRLKLAILDRLSLLRINNTLPSLGVQTVKSPQGKKLGRFLESAKKKNHNQTRDFRVSHRFAQQKSSSGQSQWAITLPIRTSADVVIGLPPQHQRSQAGLANCAIAANALKPAPSTGLCHKGPFLCVLSDQCPPAVYISPACLDDRILF